VACSEWQAALAYPTFGIENGYGPTELEIDSRCRGELTLCVWVLTPDASLTQETR
jgi:hypothetical protein